jgi:hypothetical protein
LHDPVDNPISGVELDGKLYPVFLNIKQKRFRVAMDYDIMYPEILVIKSIPLEVTHVISNIYFH